MRELKISEKMLIIERDMCIAYDKMFGEVYAEIYEKAPEIYKEITGDDQYISEYERAKLRWELEASLIGVEEEVRRSIRNENAILYQGINHYHPEAGSIVIGG